MTPLVGTDSWTAVLSTPGGGADAAPVLILAVGNLLMGDEGVGLHVLQQIGRGPEIPGVRLLDGGTGGVNLLAELQSARIVVMIDATRDGRPAGTLTLLRPDRVADLPRGLSAHDFGVKDLFAAAALLGHLPEIHLLTISVEEIKPMCMDLGAAVAAAVPAAAKRARELARRLAPAAPRGRAGGSGPAFVLSDLCSENKANARAAVGMQDDPDDNKCATGAYTSASHAESPGP